MWTFLQPISLLRYLCVWRVNRALVRLPKYLPAEISQVLGMIIANRLPTAAAQPWRKALAGGSTPFEATWPVEATLLTYPGKTHYGPGEVILWELKLMGPQVEHSFFLEIILPAMEQAGHATDQPWYQPHSLWGRFDIQAIYVARGPRWEPLVSDGRLDLRYRASPIQWMEGLTLDVSAAPVFRHLTWLTPFDLGQPTKENRGPLTLPGQMLDRIDNSPSTEETTPAVPTLQQLLESLLVRLTVFLPGKYATPGDAWNILDPDEQTRLLEALAQADRARLRGHRLEPAPKAWPGRWLGQQTFAAIPPLILPYLELASILHLGKQTHLGCGTFTIT
jgi:hypothetical protein